MALNFSRPDPSSPAAVGAAQFSVARRGYDQEEVRDFLRMVSAELARLQERERFLESEMRALQTRGLSDPGVLDEATVTQLLGAEAARVLAAAREASESMRQRAAESAEQLIREASHEASRLIDEAQLEAARRRSDLAGEVEAEIELAKQQGREMVAEVRAYREKVLADIARRNEEARRELERLVVERERLLGAFERARLAASDVVGELVDGDATLHEVGVTPPLVSPDAPPPPVQGRSTPVPFFDREKYPDANDDVPYAPPASSPEISDDHGDAVVEQEVGDESTATASSIGDATFHASSSTDDDTVTTDVSGADANMSEPTPITSAHTPNTPAATEVHDAADPATPGEHVAEVVQLFSRRDTVATSHERVAPLHPVFERVEPVADVAPSDTEISAAVTEAGPTASVDDLFARLRASSTEKVATTAKRSTKVGRTTKKDDSDAESTETTIRAASGGATADTTPVASITAHTVDPSVFDARENALTPLIDTMARKWKRTLADEENTVLTHLEGKRSSVSVDAMLPAADVHVQQWVQAITEELVSAALAGAKAFNKGLRADLRKKVGDAAVMSVVSSRIADELVRPLRERLRQAAEQSGGDRADMSSRARSVYREWKMQRIDSVSADLARLAYARGIVLTTAQDAKLCWAVDPNGPPCADAEDNSLAGAVSHCMRVVAAS
jgi:DivIVA domain-containing protein